jgi:RND family efflux transporter MFP subunit
MMNKKKSILVFLALISVLSMCIITAYGIKKPDAQENPAAIEAKRVEIVTAKREKVALLSELSATLQPGEESVISFEVPGRILEMSVNEGDQVSAGQVLARLDASDYSLQLSQTMTDIDKARVGYQQAKEDFNRMEQLYSQKAISQTDYENAQNSFVLAERDYLQAQQAYSLKIDKNLLKSPVSGTVIAKLLSVGQLVEAGTPVYRVGKVNPLKVLLPVSDRDISLWHVGDVVTLSLYNSKRDGTITRIFPSTNEDTGTISVQVTVGNPQREWYPGQVVKVSRAVRGKEGLFVPVEAVLNRGEEKPYIFLAAGEKAVKTAVTTGELFDNRLEILSGLKEGDQVVVKGADRLFDKDQIQLAEGSQND